ncbi:hypothetical protein FACS1894198_0200 [Clostridia bacterium]|nr:hypothetical protein FACS1894198_0200 [Clostridia bacterium]
MIDLVKKLRSKLPKEVRLVRQTRWVSGGPCGDELGCPPYPVTTGTVATEILTEQSKDKQLIPDKCLSILVKLQSQLDIV